MAGLPPMSKMIPVPGKREDFRISLSVKQCYRCKTSRSHLVLGGSLVDRVSEMLRVDLSSISTPCTCSWALGDAIWRRHLVRDVMLGTRPVSPEPDLLREFKINMRAHYEKMLQTKALRYIPVERIPFRYTGAKKFHYLRCLADYLTNGFGKVYFAGFAKWGEVLLKLRARCILMQVWRSRGVNTPTTVINPKTGQGEVVAPFYSGEPLRAPILLELSARIPMEAAQHKLLNRDGSRMIAAGRSLAERPADISAMCPGRKTKKLSIDMSNFDGSQFVYAEIERDVCTEYLGKMRMPTKVRKDVTRVLKAQNYYTIKAPQLRAEVYGNRASGTAGTAVANKNVMIVALKTAIPELWRDGEDECSLYSDGDDTIIAYPPHLEPLFPVWIERLTKMVFTCKVEGVAQNLEEVVFCRASPVEVLDGVYVLTKNPADAFRTQAVIRRHFKGPHLRAYLGTLREGLCNMWAGIPVNSAIGKMFPADRGTNGTSEWLLANSGVEYSMTHMTPDVRYEITDTGRRSYSNVFGISWEEQLELEKLFPMIGEEVASLLDTFELEPPEYQRATHMAAEDLELATSMAMQQPPDG